MSTLPDAGAAGEVAVMMRATAAGPAGVLLHGGVYTVSRALAEELAAGGYAVPVSPVAVETAEAVRGELAVLRRPRTRTGGSRE